MSAVEWQEITDDILSGWGWDAPLVRVRDGEGHEAVAAYGFEDENYDGDYWFCWHREDGTYLGFEPVEFAMIEGLDRT